MTAASSSDGSDGAAVSGATSIATASVAVGGAWRGARRLRAREVSVSGKGTPEWDGRSRLHVERTRHGGDWGASGGRASVPVGDAAVAMLPRHPRPHRVRARLGDRWPLAEPRAADVAASGAPAAHGSG